MSWWDQSELFYIRSSHQSLEAHLLHILVVFVTYTDFPHECRSYRYIILVDCYESIPSIVVIGAMAWDLVIANCGSHGSARRRRKVWALTMVTWLLMFQFWLPSNGRIRFARWYNFTSKEQSAMNTGEILVIEFLVHMGLQRGGSRFWVPSCMIV